MAAISLKVKVAAGGGGGGGLKKKKRRAHRIGFKMLIMMFLHRRAPLLSQLHT